jgi:diaminohydroxyphosphoribosylaminopyrimidine deaminase / 5-amino-6-(5-phosphoribosylamino)uracil reductase
MTHRSGETPLDGWALAHAACIAMRSLNGKMAGDLALNAEGDVGPLALNEAQGVLFWRSSTGWRSNLPQDDSRRTLLDLYLPITGAMPNQAVTVGHLGQSLDGFIATPSGDSSFVTGPENIMHLHRLRALCDAVVVGARTVEADNPRLTTRLVNGRNPLRVILDPQCRLAGSYHVFTDGAAPTLRVCAAGTDGAQRARDRGEDVLEVAHQDGRLDLEEVLRQLHARKCWRVFVEGGGVTVSSFLEAGLLDRLHIAVAPLLIGEGRPAIRLAAHLRLKDCMAIQPRIYRTGRDILYDCNLRATAPARVEIKDAGLDAVERIA